MGEQWGMAWVCPYQARKSWCHAGRRQRRSGVWAWLPATPRCPSACRSAACSCEAAGPGPCHRQHRLCSLHRAKKQRQQQGLRSVSSYFPGSWPPSLPLSPSPSLKVRRCKDLRQHVALLSPGWKQNGSSLVIDPAVLRGNGESPESQVGALRTRPSVRTTQRPQSHRSQVGSIQIVHSHW